MPSSVAVVGVGAVGARCARQLASSDEIEAIQVCDVREEHAARVAESIGAIVSLVAVERALDGVDAVVLAVPANDQLELAERALGAGLHVVSACDDVDVVGELLALDDRARRRGLVVAVGAGFGPGLSCVLATHAASALDEVHEIHVARSGTGGPACARQQHLALGSSGLDWREGAWEQRQAGSGRELCWFPDPIGALDCYRAALPDPLLLARAFPSVRRITARMAANRRARLTGRLPMMRPPHPEGGPGAVRAAVRGSLAGEETTVVYGAMDRSAIAAAAVAAVTTVTILEGNMRDVGCGGLAELVEPAPFLRELAVRGVRTAAFDPS